MKKLRSHLVILCISLVCPVILIGGSYWLDSQHQADKFPKEVKSDVMRTSDRYKENDSLYPRIKGL